MKLKTTVAEFTTMAYFLLPYLHLWKHTIMIEAEGLNREDDFYLETLLKQLHIKELIKILDEDIYKPKSTVKILNLKDTVAIMLFRALRNRSASTEDVYSSTIRDKWIGIIHQKFIIK
jgi:hypothetical protein